MYTCIYMGENSQVGQKEQKQKQKQKSSQDR